MRHDYSPHSYDEFFCLKPPFLLWIAMVFLSRAVSGPLLMSVAYVAGGLQTQTLQLLPGLWSVPQIAPSLLAAAVVLATLRRIPRASKYMRWIWAHGRSLLAASAVIDFVLSLTSLYPRGLLGDQAAVPMITLALDLYFLVYILAARRVRDTFADFPAFDPVTR